MNKSIVGAVILAVGLSSFPTTGCRPFAQVAVAAAATAAAVAIISSTAPPPPRYQPVVVRPGYVWVRGRWELRYGRWVWIRGHYVTYRAGYSYRPGRWVRQVDGRYRWYPGAWVVVR